MNLLAVGWGSVTEYLEDIVIVDVDVELLCFCEVAMDAMFESDVMINIKLRE